ncbi:hypothetical protein FRB94_004742 [Tulasnella sp. JGI-2019a]|nr:hypothetical protein FRB93_011398 [Tulasnella sp. JGI-2019a]KAG9012932.1 hypothetical protein FRB94_004742 [Tulasnella sp. JGI-2019a]
MSSSPQDPEMVKAEVVYEENHTDRRNSEKVTGNNADDSDMGARYRAERKLVRKLDLLIMPIAIVLYLGAYLDRGNLGNANAMGLTTDILKGNDQQYAWVASIFVCWVSNVICNTMSVLTDDSLLVLLMQVLPYPKLSRHLTFRSPTDVLCQIPGTFGPKFVPPQYWIGAVAILWGTAAASQGGTHSYAGIMVARFFMGIGEAGFGSAIPLLFSFWYTKHEIGFRMSIFIGSAAAAGVFGGLLAYGVQQIKNAPIQNWRILFLIDSLPVILAGFVCFFILPSRPATTRWLNEDERALALSRIGKETTQESHGSFNKRHFMMAVKDYRLALCYVIYMGINIALSSLGNFLPTIVASLGYTGAKAQLMTVPPYSAAFVFMTLVNYASDRIGRRGPFVAFSMLLGSMGYVMLLSTHHNNHVRYGAIFLITMGTYTTIPLMLSWVAANAGSETQRVVGLAGLNMFGQCFAILAAHVYPKSAAPYYTLGFGLSCGFQLLAFIIAIVLMIVWSAENRRRDREFGKPTPGELVNTGELGDQAPNFRYML